MAQPPLDFPEYFRDTFNPHMFLLTHNNNTFSLCPPNQCDWFYNITQTAPNTWVVRGNKNDVLSFCGPEECKYTYSLVEGKWRATEVIDLFPGMTVDEYEVIQNAPRTPEHEASGEEKLKNA